MKARIARWGMALLVLPALLASPAGAQLDFEALARTYLKGKGIEGRTPDRTELETVLADGYPSVQVGAFDLCFPLSALEEKQSLVQVRTLALELLTAQLRLAEWLVDEEGTALLEDPEFKQHVRRVTSWIKSWNGRAMARSFQRGQRDFILDEDPKVIASYQALADYFGRGLPLQLDLEERKPTRIYLIPQRKEFVELACVFGLVFPDIQFEYWKPRLWGWTFFYFEDVYFLAMEYAATNDKGSFTGDYALGTPMVEFNKKGLEQQVVQLSLMALMQKTFRDAMPAPINASLSSNLVIDLYGEVDTRTDGDLRGKKTQDRSIFVPGAVSDGVLPPDYADGRFRSPGHGSDHFTAVLRTVQREGAKQAGDRDARLRTFVMLSDTQREQFVLHAPFLVSEGGSIQPPPEPFLGDYLEFMRAYRICFLDWLRNEGAGAGPESRRAFARLLVLLARGAKSLDVAVQQVYEAPLSDDGASSKSLEGRFLEWLDGGG